MLRIGAEPTHPISQYSVKLKFRSICNAAANSSIALYSAWLRSICNASKHSFEGKFREGHSLKFNASYRILRPQHCKCSGAHALKFIAWYRMLRPQHCKCSGAHALKFNASYRILRPQHCKCSGAHAMKFNASYRSGWESCRMAKRKVSWSINSEIQLQEIHCLVSDAKAAALQIQRSPRTQYLSILSN